MASLEATEHLAAWSDAKVDDSADLLEELSDQLAARAAAATHV